MKYIPFEFTEDHINLAYEKLEGLSNTKRDIDPSRKIYGCLAEVAFAEMFKEAVFVNNRNFDFLLAGYKIEVKGCSCKSKPKPTFDAGMEKRPKDLGIQKCDYFVFFRVLKSMSKCWLCGKITRKDFIEKHRELKAGDPAPNMPGGKIPYDTRVVWHWQLEGIKI